VQTGVGDGGSNTKMGGDEAQRKLLPTTAPPMPPPPVKCSHYAPSAGSWHIPLRFKVYRKATLRRQQLQIEVQQRKLN
jgi:hypothetical protein